MKHCVFVHTNRQQMVGALVSRYSLQRNSRHADRFEVKIIDADEHPFLKVREGQSFLRDGEQRIWRYDDLQSFTPLRFMPPELMGYEGRAVVMDPDIFAVGDVWELLSRDMAGKAILCRPRTGSKFLEGCMASSLMVLDCARLSRWRCREQFDQLFEMARDYAAWICLKLEPRESLGRLEDEWNDFDRLTPATRMVHNTKRQTQPWKTGLPVDFTPATKRMSLQKPTTWLKPLRQLVGKDAPVTYRAHPDGNQERFFFGLLRECVEKGIISEAKLREEMKRNHVRHDAFEVLDRTPPLAA
jgi:hypothetical protein